MVKKTEIKGSLAPETSSQRILLEEFRLLQDRFGRNRDEGIARMNFFITAASVVLGGVLVFGSGNNITFDYFRLILFVALIVLSAIGLDIYAWLITRDISADRFERGLARIRHYFLALDPEIEKFFINSVFDMPTGRLIKKTSGMRAAAQIVESVLLSLSFTILSTFLSFSSETSILVGVTSTIMIYTILEAYARKRLDSALKNAEKDIKFKG
jgi:hypothetical protein